MNNESTAPIKDQLHDLDMIARRASIVLGVHLVQQSGGWWLQFPTSQIKAKRPYEVAFPTALIPELEHYLAILRKVLLAGESGQLSPGTDALRVSEVGTMLEKGAVANRIRKHTKGGSRRTGSETPLRPLSRSRIPDTSAMPTPFLATPSP